MKKSMTTFYCILTLTFLMGICQKLAAFPLIAEDAARLPEIVLSENPSASSKLAAQELADYYTKSTGKVLQTSNRIDYGRPQILIGLLSEFDSLPEKIKSRFQERGNDQGFYHLLENQTLYIIGQDDPGQLYGTYAFLENHLGVRWLAVPSEGDDGEYIPEQPARLELSSLDFYSEPDFVWRWLFQTGSYMSHYPKLGTQWCARVRLQGTGKSCDFNSERVPSFLRHSVGGHGLYDCALTGNLKWPGMELKRKLFAERPEIFAMRDGERFLSPEGMGRYCISNEYLQSLVVEEGLLFFKTYGVKNGTFHLGISDYGSGWCECNECLRQNQVEKYQNDISTLFHNSMTGISKKVYAAYPTANIVAAAYASHHEVPRSGYDPDPRLQIEFCTHPRCYGHFLDDPACERNVQTLNRVNRWKATGLRIFMREYDTCTPVQYCPLEEQTAHDLKLYKKMGFVGYATEARFPDSIPVSKQPKAISNFKRFMHSTWQWNYLISRLTWDTTLDPQAILTEIEAKYYGKAYPIMKQYHDYRRVLWKNASFCVGWPYVNPRIATVLNQPGSKEKLLAWLDEAEKIAAGDALLILRIQRDREYLTDFWIEPNEKLRARGSSTFYVPMIDKPIQIDGKGSDPRWLQACYSTDFVNARDRKTKMPEDLSTSVGILADSDHLYVLFTCRETGIEKMLAKTEKNDGNVWEDDSCEIFIYPMNTDEKYYQVIVNTKGVFFDAKNLPIDNKYNFPGLQAKTSIHADFYQIEVAIPVRDFGPIQNGTSWKLHFARNRRGPGQGGYTIDGEDYHIPVNYRTAVFGSALLKNITFDEVEDQKIRHWNCDLNGKQTAFPVKTPSGYAARIEKGRLYQGLALKKSPQERTLSVSFRAQGTGTFEVLFYRYADIPLEKPKNGQYTRQGFVKSERHQKYELDPAGQVYTFNYTVPANEYVSIAFHAQDAVVDDLAIHQVP